MSEYNKEAPRWACKKYGDYEHDWLDCPECIAGYEAWQDMLEQLEAEFGDRDNAN